MAKPVALYDGFLPGQHPITAYGDGGFRFAEMSHRGSLVLLPSGIRAVAAKSIRDLTSSDFDAIIAERDKIELFLVGSGIDLIPLPAPMRSLLTNAGIRHEAMQTGAAIRTYNVLLAEDRQVSALLLAV
ncbi:Mth938-like domain-containing protein [Pseudochelatococcus contaminans]|uniref:Mth938-like domain-containing protein n=1 Tax=Pseudochelatococcus contaminans TaxID=1538103 RepID=UPI00161F0BC3|nr:MTH938/NDUFAF3 family protein [Pseudochelatococcus contaminans]